MVGHEQSGLRMSAGASRREVVQAGAAAAAVTPFLGSSAAYAAKPKMEADSYAPIVTIFDHRGCTRGWFSFPPLHNEKRLIFLCAQGRRSTTAPRRMTWRTVCASRFSLFSSRSPRRPPRPSSRRLSLSSDKQPAHYSLDVAGNRFRTA